MNVDDRRLSCAETAKVVRKAVREAFPAVRFSVRSHTYAGGASIRVGWTDGPTEAAVRRVTDRFAGADFDGMTDMKEYRDAVLFANADGSYQTVHYGADFIFTSREIGAARAALLRREIERFTGEPFAPNQRYKAAGRGGELSLDPHNGEYGSTIVHQLAHAREWRGEPCPGGEGSYCPGCGRWQAQHRAPHLY